jgi:hypothetical protein
MSAVALDISSREEHSFGPSTHGLA